MVDSQSEAAAAPVGRIAVALSGGGHRATLFGLGVLLYLVDAHRNRAVNSIASVSGGSLTNGYVAQEVDYATVTPEDFWRVAAKLTTQIARRGTLWAAWLTWVYLAALVLAALAVLVGVWFLPIGLGWRLLVFALGLVLLALLAGVRGGVGARSFATTLFSPNGKPTRLDAVHATVDHVICATDLHAGEHVYFSGRFVCAYRYGFGRPGDLPLHDAVHASAAYPGGFPARSLPTAQHSFELGAEEGSKDARRMVLVDGGAYDNLGDEWALKIAARNEQWESLGANLNVPGDLVVVNSSGPMSWAMLGALRLPFVGEVLTLKRDIDVLYDTTTSTRRRWLFDTFVNEDEALRGAIVQITQSPFRIPREFAARGGPQRERANAVLRKLGDTENEWAEIVRINRGVKTTLSKLGEETAVNLVLHGYVLAMANLHVILGYPLHDLPSREHFEQLASAE
jgi:predicted acylesterase/phospholipase RssA